MSEKVDNLKSMYSTANTGSYAQSITIKLEKEFDLRYGENPNQQAGAYMLAESDIAKLTDIKIIKSGKGGVSANNLMDVARAFEILKFFKKPSVSVMKHLNPSGFATQFKNNDLKQIYINARDTDARSAFGSVVVFNSEVDEETAKEINASFVEMVAAPSYKKEALEVFETKKNLRVMTFANIDKIPKFEGDDTKGLHDLKALPSGRVIVQKPYLSTIKGPENLVLKPTLEKDGKEYSVEKTPTDDEMDDLLTAWYVNIGVRSNGIVIVKDGVTVCVGSGQQERIGAIEQAIIKAYQKAMDNENIEYDPINGAYDKGKLSKNPLEGAVMSSDAFFPFRDSIDIIAKHGIKAIIQPGGSMRDNEVIEATNDNKVSMVFTKERCFGHF